MNEDWFTRAERIRSEIAAAGHGEKGSIVRRHAEKTGYSVPSLNRDLTAAGFIAQRDYDLPEFGRDLRILSSSIVNEIARLFKVDRAKAVEKAQMAVKGAATRREIVHTRDPRLQQKKQQLLTGQSAFYRFINAEMSLTLASADDMPPWSGLPRGIAFKLRDGASACAAFVPASAISSSPGRFVSYLSLLLFYDDVFLGIDSPSLPPDLFHLVYQIRVSRDRLRLFGRLKSGEFFELEHF